MTTTNRSSSAGEPGDVPGIRELRWVRASELAGNPANSRRHPPRQMKALAASIKENGWSGCLLYNELSGHLIDGHLRKELAKDEIVPVLIGRWTPEEERRLLTTLDPISAMAEMDEAALRKLTEQMDRDLEKASKQMESESAEVYRTIAKELNDDAEAVAYGSPASFFPSGGETFGSGQEKPTLSLTDPKGETKGSFRLKTRDEIDWDAWGPGSVLDIPHLRPDRLGTIPEPITTWLGPKDSPDCANYLHVFGSTSVEHLGKDFVVCFYTSDDRFQCLWAHPEVYTSNLLTSGVKTLVTPNFSCYDGGHKAVDIYETYRGRWLGRYWQEAGLSVIPDLMLGGLTQDEAWGWRFAGVPKNAPALSIQLQQKGDANPDLYYRQRCRQLLKTLDLLTPESLLLYHGPSLPDWFVEKLPATLHVVKCRSFMTGRGDVMREKRYLHRR